MDDRKGVIFFNAGSKHGVHLAVAVATLRSQYKGPVALITEQDGPGRRACELIASDDRLGPIQVIADPSMKAGGHGVSYLSKTLLPRLSPFDATIYLDADVMVVGDISELWPDEATGEVVLTRFCDWVSTGGKMRQRIIPWGACEPDRTARMLERPWPAINTGALSFSRQSEAFCEDWHHTARKRQVWITDETAAQIIFPDHNVRVLDDRFNASVVFAPRNEEVLTREDVRIWHGHGMKFWKRPQGRQIYLLTYLQCLEYNLGGIRSLRPHAKSFKNIPKEDQERLSCYFEPEAAPVN